jgi:hypothetical protein
LVDLTNLEPGSKRLNTVELDRHLERHDTHRENTANLKRRATVMLTQPVNPTDEEAT